MARLLARVVLVVFLVIAAIGADARPGHPVVRLPILVAPAGSSVVVEPGDHLWKISASHLRGQLGREAKDGEIWPYWRLVIETNQEALRSGDPDLIYPGEVIELPDR